MNKEELITYLKSICSNKKIISAFQKIDRKDFVLDCYNDKAYENNALDIGFGQTISQPFVIAFMLELLDLKKTDKVLEVGSGSGYVVALMSQLVKEVFGVEIVTELVLFSENNLKKYNLENVKIFEASKKLGLEEYAPFDRILVSASADEIPKELIDQLKTNGVMVIPVGDSIFKIIKKEDNLEVLEFEGFSFVPLIR